MKKIITSETTPYDPKEPLADGLYIIMNRWSQLVIVRWTARLGLWENQYSGERISEQHIVTITPLRTEPA